MELPLGTEVDGLMVKRVIGEGGSGTVYLAQDLELGRPVALKLLRSSGPELTAQLLDEARATASLSHPHIVTLFSAGSYHGHPYLALEYLPGDNLRQRLKAGPLPPLLAIRLGRAVAEALAEAHRGGVIHADLKPENIVVARDGRARVVDFGLSRWVGGTRGVAGTPAYMAPERWRGAAPEPAVDLWSLGVLLQELVTGARPFPDSRLFELATAEGLTPAPVDGPPEIAALIGACLSRAPAARPTAAWVAERLAALSEPSTLAGAEHPPYRGLQAFSEHDADDFFGRDDEIAVSVEALEHTSLLTLLGPSGVGKSSFVRAGLLPRLREARPWHLVALRPTGRPLTALAAALGEAPLASVLAFEPGAAASRLAELRRRAGANVLLFVDQLEEAFTLAAPEEAAAFARCLAAAALDPTQPWRVVCALRDDFLAQMARVGELRPYLRSAVVLPTMEASGLEAAITEPLRRVGYRLDSPALATRIASELRQSPAALPLLQFACDALWSRRDPRTQVLTTADYEALGGALGALAAHAERRVSQLASPEVKRLRALLLMLVRPDGTCRPRPRAELARLDPGSESILEGLVRDRLVVTRRVAETGETMVELAHESLAVAWPRLGTWLDETHEERALMLELEQAAALWTQRGEADTETWAGDRLTQALRRLDGWGVKPGATAQRFLAAGEQRMTRARRRRRLAGAAVIGLASAIATTTVLVALEFRALERRALAQQEQIRLASANWGQFDIVLAPFDFDTAHQRPVGVSAASLPELRVALHRPNPDDASRPGPPLGASELRLSQRRVEADGTLVIRVEAPSREALLEVLGRGEGCGSSWLRLRRLPGFAARAGRSPPRLEVPVPTCAATRAGMIRIPAGPYWRPLATEDPLEAEAIEVPEFFLDRTEVSNGLFAPFESLRQLTGATRLGAPQAAAHTTSTDPTYPVTGVDAFTAEALCRYLGKRLPSLDEWRKAARGGLSLDGRPNPEPLRIVPWGAGVRQLPANLAGSRRGASGPAPVGSSPGDVSPYGVVDLGGNVSEWTATGSPGEGPSGLREAMGGDWRHGVQWRSHWLTYGNSHAPGYADRALGLRCAAP